MANQHTRKKTAKSVKATPVITKKAKAPARSTRRSTVKAAPAKSVRSEETVIESPVTRSTERKSSGFRFKKTYVLWGLAALLLLSLLYAARGLFIAATVNGQPISRLSLINELERQSGKQALDSMVTKTLILQEADKRDVQISEQQVDEEIKKIEDNLKQQGQNLEQVLSLQGLTRESLRDQVRIQKTVETLLGDQIAVSDEEVTEYIASNSASLPADANPQELKTNIQQQLRQQKLSERFQTWLAEIRQNAKVNYIVNY